jgi:CheY-like chemotaxis protein
MRWKAGATRSSRHPAGRRDRHHRAALGGQEPFAVVITDLGMPYVDGRQVANAVKQASPATPVIMLTGWGQRMAEDADIPPHVDRVLSKPPRLQDLDAALIQYSQALSP